MNINSIHNYNYNINYSPKLFSKCAKKEMNGTLCKNFDTTASVNFRGFFSDLFTNKFSSAEDKKMYNELQSVLTGQDKTYFKQLYETGKLLNNNSNDNSSTLQNLYKIYKEPRIMGLDNKKILSETIERIANPFTINQKFGKIPPQIINSILEEKSKTVSAAPNEPHTIDDINVENSSSCVAASIEFSLADKKPAEFARFVAGLSSPNFEINQKIKTSSLNSNIMDALYLLKMFEVNPINVNWDNLNIKIKPDRDAIIRARVQNTYHDQNKRSSVDVLLQSAFMQLGSQNTYNSLTDKRYGSLNTNDTGLTEFEKTFVESVVNNDGEKTSAIYQDVDDEGILKGYFQNPETVKNNLISTLDLGKNIIIGITETNADKKIIGGHEITVTDYKIKNDELYFVYNDTDDDHVGAIEIPANVLIPKIHHAGLPVEILNQQPEPDNGKKLLKEFEDKYRQSV